MLDIPGRYEELVRGVAGAALLVDAAGRCVSANDAAEALLGYEPGELTRRRAPVIAGEIEPFSPERAWTPARDWWQGAIQVWTKRGTLLMADAWSTPLEGDPAVTALFLRRQHGLDADANRPPAWQDAIGPEALSHARRSLRESEERFRGAFDASSIGMALVSRAGRFLQVNPALCDIVEYAETELLAKTIQSITHPDDVELDRDLTQQLLANAIPTYQVEKRYLRKSGAVITGRLTVSLVRDSAGEPLYFVAQLQDITPFKASGAALREAEARYRSLVEQIPAAVYRDAAATLGTPTYVSPRIESMLGYTPEEWMRSPDLWKERLHPEDRERILSELARANETGDPVNLEYRFLARDGRIVWVNDVVSLLHDEDGVPQCWQGMMVDITGRKLAEEELRAAKDAAEEASRLKSVFLSMATHELRTPLTIISGYVELLAESAREHLSADERDYLEIAQNGARTLAALVDDLLDLARIEAGRMDLAIRPVDVGEAIERVRLLVAAQAVAKGISLDIMVEPGVPLIAADSDRLGQILLNIFGNAIKFTAEGSVQGVARRVGDGVEIAVTDTGIGIAPDALSRIFDEFRQEDSSTTRRFGGTGLGLAIVKRLMEMHSGTIDVESAPGSGSRFTLWFPAAGPELPDDATASTALPVSR